MIEYKYFSKLTKKNQKKIIELLNELCNKFICKNEDFSNDDYEFIISEMHLEICDSLREQSTVNNKHSIKISR